MYFIRKGQILTTLHISVFRNYFRRVYTITYIWTCITHSCCWYEEAVRRGEKRQCISCFLDTHQLLYPFVFKLEVIEMCSYVLLFGLDFRKMKKEPDFL